MPWFGELGPKLHANCSAGFYKKVILKAYHSNLAGSEKWENERKQNRHNHQSTGLIISEMPDAF